MLYIKNVSPVGTPPTGVHHYTLSDAQGHIVDFRYIRSAGLAACLRAAAAAVDEKTARDLMRLTQERADQRH